MAISTNKVGVLIVEVDSGGALRSAGDRVIVGSSRSQTEQQWVVRQRITETSARLTESIHRHHGIIGRKTAESVFATFPDAKRTFLAAREILRTHAAEEERVMDSTNPAPLALRAGIAFGKLTVDAGQVSGDALYTAGQLASRAGSAHILAAESIVNALGDEVAPHVTTLGATKLDGLPSPIEIFEVAWRERDRDAAIVPPREPEYAETFVLPTAPPAASPPCLRVKSRGNEIVLGPARPRVTLRSGKDKRPHARIEFRGEDFYLVNLGAHGTRVRDGAGEESTCHGELRLEGEGVISLGADFHEESPEVLQFSRVS
jgi:hypothetical protein